MPTRCLPVICLFVVSLLHADRLLGQESFDVTLRSRSMDEGGRLTVREESQAWDAKETAVIVCDMWDSHHCLNAVRRVGELVPRMNEFLKTARAKGATIIHAPSSCTDFYKDHPARKHVGSVPQSKSAPVAIESWCHWKNPTEEKFGYPIDHSDGGEDDDLEEHARWAKQLEAMGRNPRSPWKRQVPGLDIENEDFITDDGVENWSILEHRGIRNVMLVGVHTNMCVLGRPFGLRQLSKNGKNVVLVRDLTDTMYNPKMPPYVSHFSGTDLIIEHIEKNVCPTIASNQVLAATEVANAEDEFRFKHDNRPHVVMLIGEQEYETASSLPVFAKQHLYKDMKVSYITASQADKNHFPGIEAVNDADLLVVSVRRRFPASEDLEILRNYVARGGPVVGIRTASHAFALREGQEPPKGHDAWTEFDAEVFGGNYQGHHGNKKDGGIKTYVWSNGTEVSKAWPMIRSEEVHTTSWLYKTSPLKPGANVLMMGRVGDRKPYEPVTWTYIHKTGGRSFYTSLGHPNDFQQEWFQQMLKAGIRWALQM